MAYGSFGYIPKRPATGIGFESHYPEYFAIYISTGWQDILRFDVGDIE
jgi:hypothetical protein